MLLKRLLLTAASAFVAVNIWTGAPLLALWVGSRLVGQTALTMTGVLIVMSLLAAIVFALAFVLTWLNSVYLALVRGERAQRQPQWLSHVGDEPASRSRRWIALTPVEQVVIVSVHVAVILLLVWFFFIARSPLPAS